MWFQLQRRPRPAPDFAASARDLVVVSTRKLILAILIPYLACHLVGTVLRPIDWGWPFFITTASLLPTSGLALYLLERRYLLATMAWLSGFALAISVASVAFQEPSIALLLTILPLLAVVSLGWPAGLVAEVTASGLAFALVSPALGSIVSGEALPIIIVGGCLTGLLGWVSSHTLVTVTEWSVYSAAQAEANLRDARQHRAELTRVLRDLDQAFYRLQRTNVALVAARKAEEEALRFKTEFVTNVSHELRTPLNLIVGFSEMMMTSPESYGDVEIPGPYRSDLNAIYRSAQHLLELVDDVLDMARIEVNRMTLARDEIDPRSLVDEAVHIVQDHVAAKRLDLKLDIEPDLPTLWIDRLRIRQVLLNLLVNAARFTEQGHIQIGIARRGDDIVFRVSDTGRGIPPQDLDKIFEEFRSTDQPLSAWHSGTGLGLPISKKLVELHHGHMGVDSVYGQGTTFWFTLPISPVVRGRWTSTEEDPPVTQVGTSSRILVAIHEDERVVRVLDRHLDSYRVIHAQDAADGSHIARELQAIGLISEHPIPSARLPDRLLRIQCPLPSARRAAIALGASDLLVKPVSRRDLLAAIEHVKRPIERLLIADDDAEIVRLFRRMLRTQFPASACLEASTGAEALQIMRSKRPDLVLLDLIMPETNGRTVLEEMAADRALADIPVILVTARGQEADDVPGLRGDIRVSKGVAFRTGEVLRCLDAIVDAMTPGWRPVRQAAAAPEEPSLG